MEDNVENKPADRQHDIKLINDKIALIGELEHIRRHALRSYGTAMDKLVNEDDPDKREAIEDETIHYLLTAATATKHRRKYMERHFHNLSDEDWCLCKSASALRQLLYETEITGEDIELDRFVDEIWGNALDMDLTGCRDCNEDRKGE